MHDINLVISWWAHIVLACAIHNLKALTGEILVLKYPHCLFCFFWINIPQSFCLWFQCNYTLTLFVPRAPLFCWTLHNCNSPADWIRQLFKPSKDAGSLVAYIFFLIGKVRVLVFLWVTSWWGRFIHFVRGHLALGVKPMTQFFDSKFYWKLGYNPSH